MTYIVTGSAGFVGSSITKLLLNEGHTVIATQHKSTVLPEIISPSLIRFTTDIFNIDTFKSGLENLLKEHNITEIEAFIHLAWNGVFGASRFNKEIQDNNIQCVVDCVRVCADLGCKKFITCGSIMEFESSIALLHSDYPTHSPIATYCYAKYYSHGIGFNEAAKNRVQFFYPIISKAYGVGDTSNRFINNTLNKIIDKEPLSFSAATQLYDFVYIDDISRAIKVILDKGKPFRNYVLGSGSPIPLKNFILDMVDLGGKPYPNEVIFGKPVGFSLTEKEYNTENIINDTGFMPNVPFKTGIKLTYDWLKSLRG